MELAKMLLMRRKMNESEEAQQSMCTYSIVDGEIVASDCQDAYIAQILSEIATDSFQSSKQTIMINGVPGYINLSGLRVSGTDVTKDFIIEKIAEINEIDTSPAPEDGPIDGTSPVQYAIGGNIYQFVNTSSTSNSLESSAPYVLLQPYQSPNNSGYYLFCTFLSGPVHWSLPTWNYYRMDACTLVGPAPAGFDPEDYPELYTMPGLLENCELVAGSVTITPKL